MRTALSASSYFVWLCSTILLHGSAEKLLADRAPENSSSTNSQVVYLSQGFDQLVMPAGWSVTQIVGPVATWTVVGNGLNPPIPPYSGAGQAKFNSFDAGVGQQARLASRVINLASAADPFLQFYMYHDDEFALSRDSLFVEISTGDSVNGPWTGLRGLSRLSPISGWRKETIALTPYIGNSHCFVSFRGVSKFGNNIFIDEIRVLDSVIVRDIGVIGILVGPTTEQPTPTVGDTDKSRNELVRSDFTPSSAIVDRTESIMLGAIVQNFGTVNEIAYQVKWMVDGVLQIPVSNVFTLLRNGRDTLSLNWTSVTPGLHNITVWAALTSDSNSLNDTARLAIQIPDSSVIFSEMFNGSTFPPTGWTTINRDGGSLLPWFQGTSVSPLTPFEGAGYAANNFQRANGNYLDDYLISSPIPGIAQPNQYDSLTFWCRSTNYPPPNQNYSDSLMILLSTSGADTSNFTTVVDYFPVPKSGWTRRGYRLNSLVPQNSTVRFALRYLHYNATNADFVGIDAVQLFRGGPTSRNEEEALPTTFALFQNYPNPFNPTTTIQYALPYTASLHLVIYNVLGQEIATLVHGIQTPGTYQVAWNGQNSSGALVGSGLYLLSLTATGGKEFYSETRKMLLVR